MSETGTKDWKVLDVRIGKTEPNPHGGNFQKFYVDFEGSPDTYWRRKEGDSPEKGNSYYGTITKGDYGPKFKKEKAPDQGGSSGKREWKPREPRSQYDPEDMARQTRSAAQDRALKAIQIFSTDPWREDDLKVKVEAWTQWFEQDVIAAGQAATQAQGTDEKVASGVQFSKGVSSSHPEKQPANESHWWFEDHLMKAGLDSTGAKRLATFILDRFDAEQGKRAEQGLSDIDTMGETLAKLESAFRKTEGENLPKDEDDMKDLPF